MAGLKRTAETQLTKDNVDDDEDVMEIPPPEGFKKADKSVLATRPMKGLPRRINPIATTSSTPSSNNFDLGPTTKNYGVPSSPFTFNPSAAGSGSAATQPITTNSAFKVSSPTVSSNATNATKTLANIFNSVSQPIPPSKPNGTHASYSAEKPSVAANDGAKSKQDADFESEVRYYASLRGLNVSFRSHIECVLEEDNFYDLSVFMDQYRAYRAEIEGEREETRVPERPTMVNGASSSSTSSLKPAPAPAPAQPTPPLSMPTPPKAFAGFPAPKPPSTAPPAGGFKPELTALPSSSSTSSAFTFASSKPTEDKGNEEKDKSAASGPSGADSKPFSFGTAAAGPSKPSPFGTASSGPLSFGLTSSAAVEKPSTSIGSGSGFGATSALGRSSSFTAPTSNTSSAFGSNGAGSSTLLPAFGSTGPSSNGFNFGSGLKPSQSFGGSSGSVFGSKPAAEESKQSDVATPSEPIASSSKTSSSFASTSGSSSGFSFGSSSVTTASSSKDVASTSAKPSAPESVASGAESREETPASGDGGEAPATTAEAAPQKALGENIHDKEGEGEEDEETLFTTRGKIFRFGKKDDKPSWNEVGVGMIRIKKKKTDDSHVRLLSRNTTTGKIMINFKLYPGIKISQTKTILNFVGHDETGASVTYRIRVKDEDGATEFRDAIESAASAIEA